MQRCAVPSPYQVRGKLAAAYAKSTRNSLGFARLASGTFLRGCLLGYAKDLADNRRFYIF